MGVTALPATSGMSVSCVGVCGSIKSAASDLRAFFLTGVVEAPSDLRDRSTKSLRRAAFSALSSLKLSSLRGTLEAVNTRMQLFHGVSYFIPFAGVPCGARLYRERAMAVGVAWLAVNRVVVGGSVCLGNRLAAGQSAKWGRYVSHAPPQTATGTRHTSSIIKLHSRFQDMPAVLKGSRGAGYPHSWLPSLQHSYRANHLRAFATSNASTSALRRQRIRSTAASRYKSSPPLRHPRACGTMS